MPGRKLEHQKLTRQHVLKEEVVGMIWPEENAPDTLSCWTLYGFAEAAQTPVLRLFKADKIQTCCWG